SRLYLHDALAIYRGGKFVALNGGRGAGRAVADTFRDEPGAVLQPHLGREDTRELLLAVSAKEDGDLVEHGSPGLHAPRADDVAAALPILLQPQGAVGGHR